jgi:hypothetical protein
VWVGGGLEVEALVGRDFAHDNALSVRVIMGHPIFRLLGLLFGEFSGFVFFVLEPLLVKDLVKAFLVWGFLELLLGGEGAVEVVEDDFFYGFRGLRDGLGEVGAGDLEGVEEQAGAAGVECVGGDAVGDGVEVELDAGAVVEG